MKRSVAMRLMTGAMVCTLLLGGCGSINSSAKLVDIDNGKDTITLGYGNFLARYTQATFDAFYRSYYGDKYWSEDFSGKGTMEKTTKKDILETMEIQYLCRKHADDYGVKIDEKQQKAIEEAADKFLEDNKDYEDGTDAMGATRENVIEFLTNRSYEILVTEKVKDETKLSVSDEESVQSGISYVKFETSATTNDDGSTTAKTDEELKKAKENAKKVSKTKGKKFDDAVKAADGSVKTANYVKAAKVKDAASDSSLPEDVIKAAMKLSDGEVSAPIEVKDDGWYVVRMDNVKDKDATKSKKEELENKQKDDHFDEVIEKWKKEITWTVDKKQWKKVKFDTLFDVVQDDNTESTDTTK